jgi:hypothetical protein
MNVYAVTPTGLRPEGMALLGEYVNNQSYRGRLTWIIVDDCDPVTPIPVVRKGITIRRFRPSWRWQPGMNTQCKTMMAGLAAVPADATAFILEDDDVYLPEYMDTMLAAPGELVGEKDSRYYNVSTGRWRVLPGRYHSSMASTMVRGEALRLLKILCSTGHKRMLDVMLWKTFTGQKTLLPPMNVIGIKGLPGRPGIGLGHRRNFGAVDNGSILRDWIGEYADNYRLFREAA